MADMKAAPSDRIIIENLHARGIVGLHEPERLAAQDILVHVILFLDLREPAATDSVASGLNYSLVARRILTHIESAERFTIEALATDIAGLCVAFPQVHHARVRVSKPHAERAAQSIAVEIERTFGDLLCPALIGLGSNVAPAANLHDAVSRLGAIGTVVSASTVYESPAIGPAASNYLNAVVRVETCLPAAEIRRMLKGIELDMGRTQDSKNSGAVPIDLDLCLLGQQVIRARDVTIPNEAIAAREYLARGCSQVLPDGVFPGTGEPLRQIADRLAGTMHLVARPDVLLMPAKAIVRLD